MVFVNDIDPVLLNYGVLNVRWYGLMFLIGIVLNYLILRWAFKKDGYRVEDLDSIAVYLFVGLVVGARLGHIIFYEFSYYFTHPLEVFKIWNGGLASHGAAIGVFLAYLIWVIAHKIRFSKYADILVLGMPVTAMFVRIGNFFNSEIVGISTGENFGVIFKRLGEDFPRHPAQLYEAVLSFFVFLVMIFIYKRWGMGKKTPPLFFVFLYILLYFVGRFVIEFWKDLHGLPESFPLSTGQVLSILPVVLAVVWFGWIIFSSLKSRRYK